MARPHRVAVLLTAVLALLVGLTVPAAGADAGPDLPTAAPTGSYPVGAATGTVQLAHDPAPRPVEVWYPADAASAAGAPRAQHTFPDGLADVVRALPVGLVVDLLAVAGITDIEDLFALADLAGVDLDLGPVEDLLPLLRLLGLTDIGQVLAFVGIDEVGELLDLVGLGGALAGITVPAVAAPTARSGPALADGVHPLVVFSHEVGTVRWQSLELVESLASHGYVVVAVDHPGTAFGAPFGFADLSGPAAAVDEQLVARVRDVSGLIDAVAAGQVASSVLDGRVATDAVAVVGHSLGGLTALLTAGGLTRGGTTLPADGRVDALVALAPVADAGRPLIADDELASIDVPTLLVAGTADTRTPIDPNVQRIAASLGGDPVVRVDIVGAGHDVFADAFAGLDLAALLGLASGVIDGLLGPSASRAVAAPSSVAPPIVVGPFDDDRAVRRFTAGTVAGFLLAQVPVGVAPPDPTDPDPVDPDPVDPDPVDPDPVDPGGPPTFGDGPPGAPVTFRDVDPRSVHHDAIVELVADGVLRGYADGTFRPGDDVTRAQLAATVARTMQLPPGDPAAFPDVVGSTHARDIGALAAVGVVTGFADGSFRPNAPVRRDHVAAILARWLDAGSGDGSVFADLGRNPHAGAIGALHELGVVRGLTADRYGPDRPVRRDQLASLLSRARPLAP